MHSGHSQRLCVERTLQPDPRNKNCILKYSFKIKTVLCRLPRSNLCWGQREEKPNRIQIKPKQDPNKYDSQSKWEERCFSEPQMTYVRDCVYSLKGSNFFFFLEESVTHLTKACIRYEGSTPFSGIWVF